ncbi:MAG: phage tail protein [Kofleriaceae bacterium]
MTTQKRPYPAGHFELQIDGHASTAYLKSIEGGFAKAQTIDEPIGPENLRIKHSSIVEIDPFSVEFGLSGANDILKWIQSSWRKNWNRRNGVVTHANFDYFKTYEHEFYDALLIETTFPALDGASKEPAYLKCKIQPENVRSVKKASEQRLQPNNGAKQKLWSASSFRLNIDGLDEMKYCNKIESFTIKQGVKKLYTGEDRFPQIEPTKIEFPNLVGSISLHYAERLLAWYDSYVVKGESDAKAQKTGSIEFLSPDRKRTIFQINLYEIGLKTAFIQPVVANQPDIKRVKFELYIGRMDLDGAGALGME